MNKICTNIKQSKKLIELGLDVNTADMRYSPLNPDIPWVWVGKPFIEKDAVPAWSLSALLSLTGSCDLSKERIEEGGSDDRYWFHDDNFHKFSNEYDNPLDAAFEMVCWLLENKKI